MALILMAAYSNYRRDPRVRREAEALVEAGHEVVFLASRQPGEPNREKIAGVDIIKLPGLANRRTSMLVYMADYALFFAGIWLHLLAHPLRYRLVHINNMPDFLVFAAILPRLLGRPVIHDVHDLMPELFEEKFASGDKHWMISLLKLQERFAGRFASSVLTVEARLKDILSARGIPAEKITVLMNLPDDRIFAPRAPMPEKAPDMPFVMVYHGTLARRLGLDIAIEAVHRLRTRIPTLQLRIMGAGEAREDLVRLRDDLGLAERISFSDGYVSVERIPALIADADVAVVPLRVSSGTDIMLPTKLLEYVCVGIPCIVPRTGTIAKYFDEQMVQFFEAGNPDSLADAILALYMDPRRRSALAQCATERFGSVYSWGRHKKEYTDLVDRLLAGGTTAA